MLTLTHNGCYKFLSENKNYTQEANPWLPGVKNANHYCYTLMFGNIIGHNPAHI